MSRIRSFDPVVGDDPRVLILGSIPSATSLRKQQYYAHRRNLFWPILGQVLSADMSCSYEQRVELIKEYGIALYDVISSCFREGSLDQDIRDEEQNDIAAFIREHRSILAVFLNGTKAYRVYQRHHSDSVPEHVAVRLLPSTSPVPGKNVLAPSDKVAVWCAEIRPYLPVRPED